PAMQPNTLEVAEIPVERLADQRVGEAVARDRAGHLLDDPRRDRLFEDFEEALPLHLAHPLEHVEAELLPDDRGAREHLRARLPEAGEPASDDLPDALGELDLARLDPPAPPGSVLARDPPVGKGPQDLLDEEGSPRGLLADRTGEVRGDLTAAQRFEHRMHLGVGKAAEEEAIDCPLAPEPGQHVPERVAARDLDVTVRAEEQEARLRELAHD